MQQIRIFLFALCIVFRVNGQQRVVDSLGKELLMSKEDTGKVALLAEFSRVYQYSRPDSAIYLAQEAYELSQKLDYAKGQSIGLNRMAIPMLMLGNFPKALQLSTKAVAISEKINDPVGLVRSLNSVGYLYAVRGEYDKAIDFFSKAKYINVLSVNPELHQIILENIGDCYNLSNRLDSAWFYTTKAYAFSKRYRLPRLRGDIERILGDIQRKRNNPAEALRYYHLSLASSSKVGDLQHKSEACLNMATLFDAANKHDSVKFYAEQALRVAQTGGFANDILKASGLLTSFHEKRKDTLKAYSYFKISTAAKDSLYSQEKLKQMLTIGFEEKMKQQEIEAANKQFSDKIKIYALLAGVAVLLILSIVILRNNKQKQKANLLLTEQKQKVESTLSELKATQAQLIQSEKMASLGELTAGIAHEIQNPLNFVNNFSEVSTELVTELEAEQQKNQRDAELEAEILSDIKQNLQKITHHGGRASAIVKGMLDHSRATTGEKQATDLNLLVSEYLKIAYHGYKRSGRSAGAVPAKDKAFTVELITDFASDVGKVELVAQEIGRVLINLYNNAFYAVQERARSQPDESYKPTVCVSTRRAGKVVEIRVEDNGIGIPESVKAKIFQPFFTTKPTGEGTGLGLSLSYDIVTKGHRGTLSVVSTEHEGTEFTIGLPIT